MIGAAETTAGSGSTKVMKFIAKRSGFWQHDIVQEVMPGISWPQFMARSEANGCC